MKKYLLKKILTACLLFFLLAGAVKAADLTSDNFIISDPIIGTMGNYGTSTNFKAFSYGDTLFTGSASSSSFLGRYGFLYHPYVNVGTLTVTPVAAQANLSWDASVAGGGWTVSGYKTGKASVSGGPYTYTDVGNVTDYSYTELPPGEYCFVVQTLDSLGYVIATSNEDCATISSVITFDIDTSETDVETDPPYTAPFATISTTDTRVSGTDDHINMIILEADTNALNGVVITVNNGNGSNGMVSASVPGDNINSADGTMADGTENYGLCVITSTLSGFSRASPYNSGACATNSESNAVQGLTTTGESIVTSSTSPVYDAHAEISVNAAISNITPAHSDYGDTLTFIATSTF